jgi:hypothetical protein
MRPLLKLMAVPALVIGAGIALAPTGASAQYYDGKPYGYAPPPPPVYVAPRPVYVPPPVYVAPRPVYVPPPIYVPPPRYAYGPPPWAWRGGPHRHWRHW